MDGRRRFQRLLLTYVFVLLIPIFFGLIAYSTAYRAFGREVRRGQQSVLSQASILIESQFNLADALANSVIENPVLQAFPFVRRPFEGAALFKVIQAMQSLEDYVVGSSFIKDFFVVYDNGAVIGRGRAYRIERFYPGYIEYPQFTRGEWIRWLSEDPYTRKRLENLPLRVMGRDEKYLSYIRPLSLGNRRRAAIVVLIDGEFIEESLKTLSGESGASSALVRDDGYILSAVPEAGTPNTITPAVVSGRNTQDMAGEPYLITRIPFERGGWMLISAFPVQIISKEMRSMLNTILAVIGAALIVGALVVVVLARRTFRPVAMLILDNEGLKNAVKEQEPYLRQALLGRLFRGEFSRESEILDYQSHAGLQLLGRRFTVVLVRFEAHDEPADRVARNLALLKDTVMKAPTGRQIYTRDRCTDSLAVLILHESSDKEECRRATGELIHGWRSLLFSGGAPALYWGIGGGVKSLIAVHRSYDEALSALNFAAANNASSPVEFRSLETFHDSFKRPENAERRLISLVVSGRKDEAAALLDGYFRGCFKGRHSGNLVSRAMAGELFATTLKILDGHFIRDMPRTRKLRILLEKSSGDTPRQLYERCRRIIEECTDLSASQQVNQNRMLVHSVRTFLEENYPQKDLSLVLAAEHFGISESYLSHLFKEQTGSNFCGCLRQIRIAKAREMLTNSNLSIKDVCTAVGYSSYPTFARVFKNEVGICAREYRENGSAEPPIRA